MTQTNFGMFPDTVEVVVPILGFRDVWIGDELWFVIEPIFGLDGIGIGDLLGLGLVPIFGLDGIGIGDSVLRLRDDPKQATRGGDRYKRLHVDPICGFEIVGIVDHLGRVKGRIKLLKCVKGEKRESKRM